MRISMQLVYNQVQLSSPSSFTHNIIPQSPTFNLTNTTKKAVFVMGSTGTGKSRLSIDIATQFPAEIINSDKIQIYKGLHILTNKLTIEQQRGIPHHLLSIIDPNSDFTAESFRRAACETADSIITDRGKLPIIAGGSNSYIESLVDDKSDGLRMRNYECCFLWVDVALPVLDMFLDKRVDEMVASGMVAEVTRFYDGEAAAGYDRGIRTAIGVREFDRYLRRAGNLDKEGKKRVLGEVVEEIKRNTRELARRQLKKIYRLRECKGWRMYRIDATEVFKMQLRGQDHDTAWKEMVLKDAIKCVSRFVSDDGFRASYKFGKMTTTTTSRVGGGGRRTSVGVDLELA